jgi:hypothetical protein
MGNVEIRPLHGDKHDALFTLATSWIPGEGHKGYFRYRVTVSVVGLDLKATTTYIKALRDCHFDLMLYDAGGFKLRDVDFGVFTRCCR